MIRRPPRSPLFPSTTLSRSFMSSSLDRPPRLHVLLFTNRACEPLQKSETVSARKLLRPHQRRDQRRRRSVGHPQRLQEVEEPSIVAHDEFDPTGPEEAQDIPLAAPEPEILHEGFCLSGRSRTTDVETPRSNVLLDPDRVRESSRLPLLDTLSAHLWRQEEGVIRSNDLLRRALRELD